MDTSFPLQTLFFTHSFSGPLEFPTLLDPYPVFLFPRRRSNRTSVFIRVFPFSEDTLRQSPRRLDVTVSTPLSRDSSTQLFFFSCPLTCCRDLPLQFPVFLIFGISKKKKRHFFSRFIPHLYVFLLRPTVARWIQSFQLLFIPIQFSNSLFSPRT